MRKIIVILLVLVSLSGMATDHYWNYGGVDHNWSTLSNWWTTDGHTVQSAAVPTSSDNCYFTSASTGNCTVDKNLSLCNTLDCTGYTGTITTDYAIRIYGSLVKPTSTTIMGDPGFKFFSTSSGNTISIDGSIEGGLDFEGSGGWTLLKDFTGSSENASFYIGAGTLNFDGKNFTIGQWLSAGGTVTSGSSLITITVNYGWTVSGGTLNLTGSTIKFTANSSSNTTFAGGGKTYNNIWVATTKTGKFVISGNNTFNDLKINAGRTVNFTNATTQVVTSLTATGTSGSKITIQSTTASGTSPIISSSGTIGCSNDYIVNGASGSYYGISFAQIGGVGTGYLGANSTDNGHNTGWNYSACPSTSSIPFWSPF